VAFALDGQLLTSTSSNKIVRLWDLMTRALHSTLKGYLDRVSVGND
jgi:WD40 repeat protein